MQITGTSSTDSIAASLGASSFGSESIDTTSFLELFVAQLQNQDPLDPIKNEQFVEQLATISSLEQLEDMNANMISMMNLNQSNALLSQLTQSSALIGSEVSWIDPNTGVVSSGEVDTVKIMDGLAVLRIGERDVPLALVTEIHSNSAVEGEAVEPTLAEESEQE